MKFLSPYSSSPASTSTTTSASFNGNITGCLAGMLRRFLCFGSLPTHPPDLIKDTDLETGEKVGAAKSNLGIVARLMGLEPVQRFDFSNSQTTCKSINFGSAKTSLSSPELPIFLENDEFFVLIFENLKENNGFGSKSNRSEVASGKLKRRKAERCGRKQEEVDRENQDPNKVVSSEKPSQRAFNGRKIKDLIETERRNHNGNTNQVKQRTKEESVSAAAKKVETECNSEISSPVSVIDFEESTFDSKIPTSGSFSLNPSHNFFHLSTENSSRKLLAELESFEYSPRSKLTGDVETRNIIGVTCRGSMKKDLQRIEICEVGEGEMEESNWVYGELWRLDVCKHVCEECGLEILLELIKELVDQLVDT